ncbi:MAG: hypothetical protein ACTSV1_02060 [Alphaproteobacteria bacterium]
MTAPGEQTDEITAILEEVDKVESVITNARRLLVEGKMVDLTALEGKIRTLCDRITAADMDKTQDVGDALKTVLDKLQQLGDEIVEQHGSIGVDPSDTSVKSAIGAYEKDS